MFSDFWEGCWEADDWRKDRSVRTGLECSTVKKSGLVRNFALGDCSSRVRRDLELDWATLLPLRSSATNTMLVFYIYIYAKEYSSLRKGYLGWGADPSHPAAAHWPAPPPVCCRWLSSCVCSDTWVCVYVCVLPWWQWKEPRVDAVNPVSVCSDLRFSCSICWMELDLWRVCGAGGAVGRCQVVVLLTWST